jgi:leader peptidase (prepilin peptidase)/N-methyltransferase
MEIALAILFGLILGSFTSVVVERLGRRGGIVAGRSECVRCGHILGWYDLIPLASFLLLRGKCRYCKGTISWLYPVIETAMAGALAFYIYVNGFAGGLSLLEMGIIVGLVMLFFFDFRHHLLPDELVVPTAVLAVVRIAVYGVPEPVQAGMGALLFMLLFGILHVASNGRWMGFGDVGLGAVLGLILGWPASLFVLVFAVWVGALVGVMLMFAGRAHMKSALPFGSFLTAMAIGALIRQDLFEQLAALLII